MKKMGVDQRREQIVSRADGVEIAIEMKIEFRARLDLRKPAACRAAFHSEHRAERWLTRSNDDPFADMRKPLCRLMEVTVLPSPAAVGVVAVTTISLPRRWKVGSERSSSRTLPLSEPICSKYLLGSSSLRATA